MNESCVQLMANSCSSLPFHVYNSNLFSPSPESSRCSIIHTSSAIKACELTLYIPLSVCPLCATLSTHATATYHCNRLSQKKDKWTNKKKTNPTTPWWSSSLVLYRWWRNKSCVFVYEWMCRGYYILNLILLPPLSVHKQQLKKTKQTTGIDRKCCSYNWTNKNGRKEIPDRNSEKYKKVKKREGSFIILIAINLVIVAVQP